MGHRTVATSTALVTLLLLSVLITASTPAPLVMAEEMAPLPASGRSSTPEVFLASGGSNSHDEFSGAIVASDAGYFVAGDVNSSAQALTFGTHTYIPTSPYSNGNDFYLASLDDTGNWNLFGWSGPQPRRCILPHRRRFFHRETRGFGVHVRTRFLWPNLLDHVGAI